MPPTSPYRSPDGPVARAVPAELRLSWEDSEHKTNPMKAVIKGWFVLLAVLFAFAISQSLGWIAAAVALGAAVYAWTRRSPSGDVQVSVAGDSLLVAAPGRPPARFALADLRNVEIERKAIKRVTYQQHAFDALPSTEVSGDVELARIVLSVEGQPDAVPLVEAWAPVFVCTERFGKVRSFLRAHGWLPLPERDAPPA